MDAPEWHEQPGTPTQKWLNCVSVPCLTQHGLRCTTPEHLTCLQMFSLTQMKPPGLRPALQRSSSATMSSAGQMQCHGLCQALWPTPHLPKVLPKGHTFTPPVLPACATAVRPCA
jgi:hypothetical protein